MCDDTLTGSQAILNQRKAVGAGFGLNLAEPKSSCGFFDEDEKFRTQQDNGAVRRG